MPRARARAVPLLATLMLGAGLPAPALAQTAGPQLAQTPPPQIPGLSDQPPPFEGGSGGAPAGGGGDGADGGSGGSGGGVATASGDGDGSGGGEGSGGDHPTGELADLPRTGGEPILLALTGAGLALMGTGLRLRTLDADLF